MAQLKERAIIGSSINVKGTLGGEEDLIIQGHVEGKIKLPNNSVTIGKNGHIQADIHGKVISIEGDVEGNLFASEKIVVRQNGVVRGNMDAPRINLEDGAKFKGSIDMDASIDNRQPTLHATSTKTIVKNSKTTTDGLEKRKPEKHAAESGQKGLGLKTGTPSSQA